MDSHKSAAERIRPILLAMEQSIESARRSRVKPPQSLTPVVAPKAMPPQVQSQIAKETSAAQQAGQRLKARPKRLDTPFFTPAFDQTAYRSQAS